MNYLYKLVTTENVEINYDTFKKKEFIECLATMRNIYFSLKQENKQLKDKLSKIETLIINHNCDTGDIYYKYNSKFLKSELKQRILEILYGESSDSNGSN